MYSAFTRPWRFARMINLCHQPWPATTAIAPRLSASELIEEENTPYYHPEHFYPAKLGELLQGRYQITTKIGFGSGSTVWLARDLWRCRWRSERFVAVKIVARGSKSGEDDICSELAMLKQIGKANPRHKGWHFVRKLVDDFRIAEPHRNNTCLVFDPMREPLWLYARRHPLRCIPANVLKVIIQMILDGLEYLHDECHIIHADLKPNNIMVRIEDPAIFERDARAEYSDPLPQKHVDGRIIYLSRNNYGAPSGPTGIVQIVDFDRSVSGTKAQSGCIQADTYRAPEVILDAGYTYSADIWSLGVMLWDLLEGRKLFQVIDAETGEYDEDLHLAQITALLGPQAKQLVTGKRSSMFYDLDGLLRKQDLVPKTFNFENSIQNIKGEEKEMFIKFVKRMINWCPAERSTAKELLKDPWLHTDFPRD
ncbi:kinase-like protein [Acrodontium crateriforme]|uniref:non-specific serine/threonine protein kinase n=1 Tax=Acrodontium crateriforme TaxID=150365 RepID=A0AAQ3M7F9_9PEZI|nr:kinase-like protein [Acrodontium crateriforme]